jgi:hypothetical protein
MDGRQAGLGQSLAGLERHRRLMGTGMSANWLSL